VLARYDTLRLEIQGHTDSDGPDDYNLELSQARAQSVVNYFTERGLSASRFVAMGYGEGQPMAPNDSATNKALNRRVEFIIVEQAGDIDIPESMDDPSDSGRERSR